MTTPQDNGNGMLDHVVRQSRMLEEHRRDHVAGQAEIADRINRAIGEQVGPTISDMVAAQAEPVINGAIQQGIASATADLSANILAQFTEFRQLADDRINRALAQASESLAETEALRSSLTESLRRRHDEFVDQANDHIRAALTQQSADLETQLNESFANFRADADKLVDQALERITASLGENKQFLAQVEQSLWTQYATFQNQVNESLGQMNIKMAEFISESTVSLNQQTQDIRRDLQQENQSTRNDLREESLANQQNLLQRAEAAQGHLSSQINDELEQTRNRLTRHADSETEKLAEAYAKSAAQITEHGDQTAAEALERINANARRERNTHIKVTVIGMVITAAVTFGIAYLVL